MRKGSTGNQESQDFGTHHLRHPLIPALLQKMMSIEIPSNSHPPQNSYSVSISREKHQNETVCKTRRDSELSAPSRDLPDVDLSAGQESRGRIGYFETSSTSMSSSPTSSQYDGDLELDGLEENIKLRLREKCRMPNDAYRPPILTLTKFECLFPPWAVAGIILLTLAGITMTIFQLISLVK